MDEEKLDEQDGRRSRFAHRCAVCARAATLLSVIFLAKRLRDEVQERRQQKEQQQRRHRFPIFTH